MKSPVKWMTDEQFEAAALHERLVAVADSQVGVREEPRGSNGGPRVEMYQASTGAFHAAWCASFVKWCALRAGYSQAFVPKAGAAVIEWRDWARNRSRLIKQPKRGCLGYWLNANGKGHVFICISSWMGLFVRTIEGNTDGEEGSREGDGVYKRTRFLPSLRTRHEFGFIDMEYPRP